MSSVEIKTYPPAVRVILVTTALLLIALTLKVMVAISKPSQYVNAYKVVSRGPQSCLTFKTLPVLDFRKHIYLVGPIVSADPGDKNAPLFSDAARPLLSPAFFTDDSGAVEVLAHSLPLTAHPAHHYTFDQPLHILGWRTSDNGLRLFVLASSQAELLGLLSQKTSGWKSSLFLQGFWLALLVFTIFWLFNIFLLSNPSLQTVQLLIVNLVFLVLFFSVIVLSEYPLTSTLLPAAGIIATANLIFIPLALLVRRRRRS